MSTKTKAHIRYKNKEGKIVPGATTITNILNKPALIKWANRLGLQGIDSDKYRDEMADIGILAHYLTMMHLRKEEPDISEYSQANIDKAENCLLSFYAWEKSNPLKPILLEQPLVSERYQYGGTIDLLAKINGDLVLIDFKTGKALYSEATYQVAAYKQLLHEANYSVGRVILLRIGRDESEGFEIKSFTDLTTEWRIFYHSLCIYKLKKEA